MTDEDDYRELQDQLRRECEAAEADAPFPWVREPFHARDGSMEYYWVHPSAPMPMAVRWDGGWMTLDHLTGIWEPVRGPVCPLPRPPMHPALRVTMVRDRGKAKPDKAAKPQAGTVDERAAKVAAYLRAPWHGPGWHDVREVARKFRWPDLDQIMATLEHRQCVINTRELTTNGRPRRQWRLTDERES